MEQAESISKQQKVAVHPSQVGDLGAVRASLCCLWVKYADLVSADIVTVDQVDAEDEGNDNQLPGWREKQLESTRQEAAEVVAEKRGSFKTRRAARGVLRKASLEGESRQAIEDMIAAGE